ncbi:uncharacterized protein LOC126828000 isoform X2 [Patella vulgata]|nr:uncharacterized protein LOC126828000 isoform X2 [Patella vulgata]
MSDKDIRKKLQEIGLSTEGIRQELIKRHQDFSLLHNSDCDSLNPKTTKELIKCYEKSEKLKQKLAATSTIKGLNIDKNADATQIRKVQKTYVKKHKNQFTDLIEQTKKRMLESKKHMKKIDRNNLPSVNVSSNENKSTILTESSINNVESLLPAPLSQLENGVQSTVIDPDLNSNFLQDIPTKGILTRQISTSSHGSFDLFPDNDIDLTYSDKKKYSDENRLKNGDDKHESGCKSLCRKSLFSHQTLGKVTPPTSPRKNAYRIDHYFSPSPEKISFKMSPFKGCYVDDSGSENGDVSSVRNISQIIDNSLCTTDEHVSDLWPALTQKSESTNNEPDNIDTLDNSDATSDIIPVKIMEPPSLDVIRRPTRSSIQKQKEEVVRRSGRRKRQDEDQEETRPTKRQKR